MVFEFLRLAESMALYAFAKFETKLLETNPQPSASGIRPPAQAQSSRGA